MTTKITEAQVQRDLFPKLQGFKDQAAAVKATRKETRNAIQADPMTSDLAKRGKLDMLKIDTREKLDGIKAEQQRYVDGLKSTLLRQLHGNQPADAASVVSRRDAADRARKLDRKEAMEVLQDAVAGNDPDFAHAIGTRARNLGWEDVAEAYTAAHPDTADTAAALSWVESNTTGAAYNVSNSATYSDPID